MDPHRENPSPSATHPASDSPALFIPESQRELPSAHIPRSRWITIAIITALWHLFIFWYAADVRPPAAPERTAITTVDPAKLAAMRQQQRGLLLSKDRSPIPKTPENLRARYDSDRNRIVEKEQRAARTNVIPQPRGGDSKTQSRPSQSRKPPSTAPEKLDLSKLGAMSSLKKPLTAEDQERALAAGGQAGPAGDGADQAIMDPSLATGAENMLNTRESVYYTFYSRIYETIGPLWQSKIRNMMDRKISPGQYTTLVEVVLDGDGNFIETRLRKLSGIESFDRSVTEAWAQIPRYPNPPKALVGEDGYVRMGWTFVVTVDSGFGMNYAPPSRTY